MDLENINQLQTPEVWTGPDRLRTVEGIDSIKGFYAPHETGTVMSQLLSSWKINSMCLRLTNGMSPPIRKSFTLEETESPEIAEVPAGRISKTVMAYREDKKEHRGMEEATL
ncbi:MAG: hypothetical protein ACE5LV_02085 [Candidatus Aminicenantales bacterium]